MVRLREARRAYRRFHARCFWSSAPEYRVVMADLPWVAERLMTFGGRDGWDVGARLCRWTAYQAEIARTLSATRSFDSYLAGGAAIHLEPNSSRYSNDLDYFHDSVERVAQAFAADLALLEQAGHELHVDMGLPGYVRATVARDDDRTKVEWAHDSAWRFMPTVRHELVGFVLHPIDLAINKLLALAGRDEPRDFLDIQELHARTLPLGALCWAAAGKDPGYTPLALLDILRRRGKYRPEDFSRLQLARPVAVTDLKPQWLAALAAADAFVRSRPPAEMGCLDHSKSQARFVAPGEPDAGDAVPHFGRPGGVLPRVIEG